MIDPPSKSSNMASFIPFNDYIEQCTTARRGIGDVCRYGVDFLDRHLLGIHPTEIVVVTANPSVGKSDFVLGIAIKNLAAGKRVAIFMLEGDKGEPGDRMKWLFIANDPKYREALKPYSYVAYRLGLIPREVIEPIEDEVVLRMNKAFKHLIIYDKMVDQSVENIQSNLSQLNGKVDLIVIDHLHYFHMFSNKSENEQVREIMMSINKCTDAYRIPVILVAHTRKPEKFVDDLIPNMSSVLGTKSVVNIAHTVISMANFESPLQKTGKFVTLFKILKSRNGYKNKNCFVKLFDMGKRIYDKGWGEYTPYWNKDKVDGAGYSLKVQESGDLTNEGRDALDSLILPFFTQFGGSQGGR